MKCLQILTCLVKLFAFLSLFIVFLCYFSSLPFLVNKDEYISVSCTAKSVRHLASANVIVCRLFSLSIVAYISVSWPLLPCNIREIKIIKGRYTQWILLSQSLKKSIVWRLPSRQ